MNGEWDVTSEGSCPIWTSSLMLCNNILIKHSPIQTDIQLFCHITVTWFYLPHLSDFFIILLGAKGHSDIEMSTAHRGDFKTTTAETTHFSFCCASHCLCCSKDWIVHKQKHIRFSQKAIYHKQSISISTFAFFFLHNVLPMDINHEQKKTKNTLSTGKTSFHFTLRDCLQRGTITKGWWLFHQVLPFLTFCAVQ